MQSHHILQSSTQPVRSASKRIVSNRIRGRQQRRAASRGGFTLLELLLVLAILIVLGGIVAVNVVGTRDSANVDATTTQLKMLKSNIDMYQIRMGGMPQSLEELKDGPQDSAKKAKWVAPIITEIPTDAWGNAFEYKASGNSYEIRSAGIDGQMNSDDDIVVTP
ncbi:type II secretion system protein GspG [Stieleria sp. JC731]|uniref:type II secretion system protein GspG n=1 Tax=Pirellulaceae TaxID=2691357 RepID=UPI001E504C78|nr:type II secretion system protein GspG [Stieleria sp. JC731]MCC9601667.1 type II secretion system protein GspG [Stieleria sp. JC731]